MPSVTGTFWPSASRKTRSVWTSFMTEPTTDAKQRPSLEQTQPSGPANLPEALQEMAGRIRRRGLLVLISDLLDDPEPMLSALARFTHRGSEVIVFQVLHPDELNLPDMGGGVFTDAETGQRIILNVPDIRPAYEKRMRRFLDTLAAAFKARGIDYQRVRTDMDYAAVLQRYLIHRAAG